MKKKRIKWLLTINGRAGKLWMIMKLTFVLVFAFVMGLSANTLSQQKVNLKMGKTTYEKVFEEIKKQTGHYVIYNNKRLDKDESIEVNFVDEKLDVVLNKMLKGKDLVYLIKDEFIILKPAPEKKEAKPENKPIKGKVTDSKGNPLPGVSILIKGTKVGVATDVNGKFTIVADIGDVLVVSFMGMQTQEYKIKKKKGIEIKLIDDSKELDEVVITGYQRIEKRKLTSAITTVKGRDIIEPVSMSIDKMLQGKIAGLAVLNQSSTPGVVPKLRFRGSASISGNREPLWVLNGIVLHDPVPLTASELNSLDKVNLIGNAISSINPQDIERIDILKDASATAIYGSKAANGVIVITTKKGNYGKPSINYSTSVSMKTKPQFDDMFRMNGKERLDLSMEIREKGLNFEDEKISMVGYEEILDKLWKREISYDDYLRQVNNLTNTDWYDILFQNAISQNHSLSVSGASDKTNYYFSLGYGNNIGATKGVGLTRYTANVNINTEVSKKLKFGFSLNFGNSENDRFISSVDPYKYAYETSPLIPAYNEDGTHHFYAVNESYGNGTEQAIKYPLMYNILNEKKHGGSTTSTNTINFSGYLDYKIKSWLHFNTTFGYSLSNSNQQSWADDKSYEVSEMRRYPYGKPMPTNDEFGWSNCELPYGGYLKDSQTKNISYTMRGSLSANKRWGKHGVSVSLGYEMNSSEYKGLKTIEFGYLPDRGRQFIKIKDKDRWKSYFSNLESSYKNDVTDRISNFISYYSTFSYSYTDRYIINFNVRGDASNKFGQNEDAKFLPIWSVSGRWNVYEEGWLKDVMWLNSFSIRSSLGIQGNVSMEHSPYLIVNRGSMDSDSEEYISTLNRLPNPSLRWEKTRSINIGCDFALFDNFIYGNVEYYTRKGTDQVISKKISSTNGDKEVSINGGDIHNKGWELSFSCNPINKKNIGLGISFNTGKNYNEVRNSGFKTYEYDDYISGSIIKDGQAVNTFYSYVFGGLDKNGLPTFKNLCEFNEKGERVINSKEELYEQIFVVSGKREPDLNGGFSTSFRYKRFNLNMNFSFSLGAKERLNDLYKNKQLMPAPQQNMSSEFVNRWRKPGDEERTNIPAISTDNMLYFDFKKYLPSGEGYWSKFGGGYSYWTMYNASDIRVVSKDFLRCRGASFSYRLKESTCRKLSINSLSLSFSANNLFVIKDSKLKGRDPEQIKLGSGAIPPQRTYSLGLNINF